MLRVLFAAALLMTGIAIARAEDAPKATLYKSPQCSCCEAYASYLRSNGFDVTVKATHDLADISRQAGVPSHLQGCHTMFVDGYVVDGHVPVNILRRLLSERPSVAGISLPGMPTGSPGMGGSKSGPFVIYALPNVGSAPSVYAKE